MSELWTTGKNEGSVMLQYVKGVCYCCGKEELIVDEICDVCVKGNKVPIEIRYVGIKTSIIWGPIEVGFRLYLNNEYLDKSTNAKSFNLVVPVTPGRNELRLEVNYSNFGANAAPMGPQGFTNKFPLNRSNDENPLILELKAGWSLVGIGNYQINEVASETNLRKKIDRKTSAKKRAEHYVGLSEFDKAIDFYEALGEMEEVTRVRKLKIREREESLDYDAAIRMWEELGENNEAARVRKLKAEQGSVRVDQTVVHGDYVDDRDTTYVDDRDTIIQDSVVSKSNVGAGGDDKFARLEKLTEMKEKGLIDDDDYEKMKREIIG